MSSATLTAAQAERRLLVLTASRWTPVGLVFGLTVLLPLERGLTLPEIGLLLSIQGFVVLGLELPTGGLADAIGRRPLLIASGILAIASAAMMAAATTFWMFAVALLLQGVFRALDSGPLEAWYVDAAIGHDRAHPIERGLSRASVVLGAAIAAGAVLCGGLVAWHPLGAETALTLPFVLTTVLYGVHSVLLLLLVREAPRRVPAPATAASRVTVRASFRAAPRMIADGVLLLRRAPALRALVLVEVFWSVAMIAFETLASVKLAEDVGGEDAAAALFAPASAVAWGLFAVGALVAGRASGRLGVARTAMLARVLNGAFVVAMGLVAGPIGLIAAYWLTYVTHGAAGPMHSTLLHREAMPRNRALVLSMNSMVAGGSYSIGLLVLTPLAAATSTSVALITAGAFSVIGAFFYVPARRRERTAQPPAPSVGDAE